MELKVWVDGVQRIVCGVTEMTTCQEVVIALAQAIGESEFILKVQKYNICVHSHCGVALCPPRSQRAPVFSIQAHCGAVAGCFYPKSSHNFLG